ncbi:MAG: PspC domain-containing protein [Bacteroidota bacterium]
MKRLHLSETDRKMAGVCGGIGEYFNVDPTIVRIVVVALALMAGILPLVIGYLLAWAIIPNPEQPSS